MRAVNQAIGRVIRHKDDYGAVLLADERFSSDSMRSQLSLWLRPLVESHGSFGRSMQSLTQFFKRSSDSAPVPRLRPPPNVRQEPSGGAQAASGGMPLGGLEGILGVSGVLQTAPGPACAHPALHHKGCSTLLCTAENRPMLPHRSLWLGCLRSPGSAPFPGRSRRFPRPPQQPSRPYARSRSPTHPRRPLSLEPKVFCSA